MSALAAVALTAGVIASYLILEMKLRRREDARRVNRILDANAEGRAHTSHLLASGTYAELVVGVAVVRVRARRPWNRNFQCSVLEAEFVCGSGPRFRVSRRGGLWSRFAGRREDAPELGPLALRSPDREAALHCLTPRARELLGDFGGYREVVSDGRRVTVVLDFVREPGPALDEAKAVTAELASFGALDVARYAALPGLELHRPTLEPSSPFGCHLATDEGDVELSPLLAGGLPGLILSLRHGRDLPDFEADLGDFAAETVPATFDSELIAWVEREAPEATLANRGQMAELRYRRPPEPDTLSRGLQLLTELTSPPRQKSAFR